MKLRILNNSLRLRLERDEVDRMAEGDTITSTITFPGGATLVYRLTTGDANNASFLNGEMTVTLAATVVSDWANDDTSVSIRDQLPTAEGNLQILVEKDFECLEPRPGETQANRFPNPKAPSK